MSAACGLSAFGTAQGIVAVAVALASPPRQVVAVRSVDVLAPRFSRALLAVIDRMRVRGHACIVTETFRTSARQAYLYGFGRDYDDGRGVVTYSRAAVDTWHGYCLAADVVCAERLWSATAKFWRDLGECVRLEGLRWGNDWDDDGVPVELDGDESFSDRPHIQWGRPMRRSPSARALQLLESGGMEAVWREVGAL